MITKSSKIFSTITISNSYLKAVIMKALMPTFVKYMNETGHVNHNPVNSNSEKPLIPL
jgi:hypothetical protein